MNEPVSPPGAPPPKKGLPPLAWFAIGCGILILLLVGSCFVVGGIFFKQTKQFVEDLSQNPEAASIRAAEFALRANPEVEVISSDPKKGTITIREKATGKEIVLNLGDIRSGSLSVKSGDEESTITFGASESGGLQVAAEDGTATFGGGGEPPQWMPRYPDGRLEGFFQASTPDQTTGGFTLLTGDEPGQVLDFFESELKSRGFSVHRMTLQFGSSLGALTGEAEGKTFQLTLTREGSETKGLLQFTERKGS